MAIPSETIMFDSIAADQLSSTDSPKLKKFLSVQMLDQSNKNLRTCEIFRVDLNLPT